MAQGQRHLRLKRAAHLACLRLAAASDGDIQALHRPGFRCQGARYRRPLCLAARACPGAVRGREEPDAGARPQPADVAASARPGRSGAATTTTATARRRCSPPSISPQGKSSATATDGIAPRSSASSSTRSRRPCRRSRNPSRHGQLRHPQGAADQTGSPSGRASMCTSRRPMPPGSIRSSACSPS